MLRRVIITASAICFIASCTKDHDKKSDSLIFGTYKGVELKNADLTPAEQKRIYEAEMRVYETGKQILAQRFVEEFFKQYQKENNIDNIEKARQSYFDTHSQVSDIEAKKFLEEHKNNPALKQMPSDAERLNAIRAYLGDMARRKALTVLIEDAESKGEFKLTGMTKPVAPTFKLPATPYMAGPSDAKVVIAEFADYQCQFCVKIHDVMAKVREEFKGKSVRFDFHDFPILSIHPEALPAAIAARCAFDQNHYWEMHDKIFTKASSEPLSQALYTQAAKDVSLDMTKFEECSKSEEAKKAVMASLDAAKDIIQATPSIFINGAPYEGELTFEAVKAAISAKL